MDADRSSLAGIVLHVERLTEPYSGLPLVGVGGHLPAACEGCRVEVRYDGETAAVAVPSSATDGSNSFHFSTQLPVEPAARRVQVVLAGPGGEDHLFDAEIGTVRHRDQAAEPAVRRGVLGRGVRSVASGEVFSPWRWRARLDRFSELMLRVGQKVEARLLARRFRPRPPHDTYVENTALTPRLRAAMAEGAKRFRHRPKVSVLLPVYDVEPKWLHGAIESVRGQIYDNWELCIADDASTLPTLRRYLDQLPTDPRIKFVRRDTNGHISAASNAAADLATGEFVALLDHDDALAPHALSEVVRLLQSRPDADLVYSDEDKIDAAGRRYDPQFKPDWSPGLLLSYNYVNHFTCVRRTVFERAGRFREGYEGSQDHDLLLRVTELTDRVYHVPHVLYHWRSLPGSTATAAGVKGYVHTSGRRAVEDAFGRRGIQADLYVPNFAEKLGLPVLAVDGPDAGPTVAVVIRGGAADAARTVRAVKGNTAYRTYTVYLAVDPAAPADALNRVAAARTEDYLLFLEAGVEPADPRWLSRLVANAQLPGVGAAGGLLRAADGSVAGAGTVLGMKDGIAPAHAGHGLPAGEVSYYFYAEVTRDAAAPTKGCLLTRRDVFDRAGGFDADRFGRSLYDVDYCTRLRGLGLRTVHVGGAELKLAGGSTRPTDRDDLPGELLAYKHAHGREADPFYNPNLSDRHSFRPRCDGPLLLPAEARSPAVRAVVAAHNLNNPEGAPRYLSEIVLGLLRRGGLDPVVFSPSGGAGERVYREAGVPVEVAAASWGRRFVDGQWSPREYESAQWYADRFLRGRKPEVVVANTLLTFPLVEAAARLGVPAVWVIHESYTPGHLARLFTPFARGRLEAAFASAARVVPASHDTAALFRRLDARGNFTVLHNGLEAKPFDDYLRRVSKAGAAAERPGTPGTKRIVAVGTVCERKGQHTLVEAAARLAKARSDFAVDLVGVRDAVPYAGYVRQLVRRRRLEEVVHLIGETDDVRPYLRAADVFVCTSHMETFSRAVLEAEAFGLPIVSTPCPGVSEQVVWGANALRFDYGDAAGLADQLGTLLADDRLRGAFAAQSRAAFDNHLGYGEMLDRYEAVVLAAARTGPRAGRPFAPAAAVAATRRAA